MNFIYIPTVFTAIIYYIETFICEKFWITELLTCIPGWWTLIIPAIYLVLAIRKKHKIGIIINILLIIFCLDAFCDIPKIPIDREINYTSVNEETDRYFEINYSKDLKKFTVKDYKTKDGEYSIDPVMEVTFSEGKEFDIYHIRNRSMFSGCSPIFARILYDYVTEKGKPAIIYGNFGFPERGLNYEFIKEHFNMIECETEPGHYILFTQSLIPYYYSNLDRDKDRYIIRFKLSPEQK